MFTFPRYVVVDGAGRPEGFDNPFAAAEYFHRNVTTESLSSTPNNSVDNTHRLLLDGEETYCLELPTGGSRPRLGYVGYNVNEWPIEAFTNYHITQRPASAAYYMDALVEWESRTGPRVGDAIIQADGGKGTIGSRFKDYPARMTRFTHAYRDRMQTGGGSGSYHLTRNGFVSYSGGLDPAIPMKHIVDTGIRRWSTFWFFFDGHPAADHGVDIILPIRVYREVRK